eukprot:scaffold85669_cov19-Tisochrysis_lutea.AAC.1
MPVAAAGAMQTVRAQPQLQPRPPKRLPARPSHTYAFRSSRVARCPATSFPTWTAALLCTGTKVPCAPWLQALYLGSAKEFAENN